LPSPPSTRPERRPTSSAAPTFVIAVAVLSLAAAGIHFAVVPSRFVEDPVFGMFFSVLAWGQTLWTLGFVRRRTRPVLFVGAFGASTVVIVWIWARTMGLPIGPTAGVPLRPSFAGILATALEVIVALACGVRLVRSDVGAVLDRRLRRVLVAALVLVVVVLTTAALAAGDATTT
jgi:hypothetical protein